jgi:hypothetical protein
MKREPSSRGYVSIFLLLLAAWIFVSVLESLYG